MGRMLAAALLAGLVAGTEPDPLPRRNTAPPEAYACCDVTYGSVVAPSGQRLRTILTRPRARAGRLPAILFTAWLSCDSVELRPGAEDGWSRFQRALIEQSGAMVMRVDKPGVGDSEGVCAETDYDTEVGGYRAALEQLARRDDVDPGRLAIVGGSMGGATAPLLAQGRTLKAVAVWGTFARTWLEHLIDLERRRLALEGDPAGVVNEKMRVLPKLDSLYGRPAAFHHQAQAVNLLAAWEKVDAPVLSVRGEYDWIMSRADQEPIAETVNRLRPGTARFVEIPRTDHHFMRYDTPQDAFREKGGRVSEEAVGEVVTWVRDRLADRPPAADSAALESYRRARAVVEAGILALGGVDALRAAGAVHRRMSRDWFGSGQGPRPEAFAGPTLKAPRSNSRGEVDSVIDYPGQRWVDAVEEGVGTDDAVTVVTAVAPDGGFESTTYRKEKPFLHAYSSEESAALRVARFRRYPEGVLLMALDRPETLQWVGREEGRDVVSFADAQGARVLLSFDGPTQLLAKWETLRSHAIAGDSSAELLFDDYRPVGSLKLPFHYVDRVAGVPTQEWRASAIALQADVPPERFLRPREFAATVEDPSAPTLQRMGEGLYLVRAGYNTMFAVFRDFAIVFEAPLSSAFTETVRERVRATVPDKPVRFVVATHFHFDHLAGLRPYVADGATVLTTVDAGPVVERVAAASHTLHPDALSRHPVPPHIEPVTGARVIDDGVNRVELYDVGPSEHAAHILVAYFPRDRVLFVPDLWDVVSTELVIAGSDTVVLARRVRALGLRVERIVPVHGAPATMEMLEQALAVRGRYVK